MSYQTRRNSVEGLGGRVLFRRDGPCIWPAGSLWTPGPPWSPLPSAASAAPVRDDVRGQDQGLEIYGLALGVFKLLLPSVPRNRHPTGGTTIGRGRHQQWIRVLRGRGEVNILAGYVVERFMTRTHSFRLPNGTHAAPPFPFPISST